MLLRALEAEARRADEAVRKCDEYGADLEAKIDALDCASDERDAAIKRAEEAERERDALRRAGDLLQARLADTESTLFDVRAETETAAIEVERLRAAGDALRDALSDCAFACEEDRRVATEAERRGRDTLATALRSAIGRTLTAHAGDPAGPEAVDAEAERRGAENIAGVASTARREDNAHNYPQWHEPSPKRDAQMILEEIRKLREAFEALCAELRAERREVDHPQAIVDAARHLYGASDGFDPRWLSGSNAPISPDEDSPQQALKKLGEALRDAKVVE